MKTVQASEKSIEQEIQSKGLTAPRLTPEMIDDKIKEADYFCFEGSCTTVCQITLKNGFTVIGSSACASPDNFDEKIGRTIALGNARQQIWQLEGYLLKEALYNRKKS